MRPKVTILIDSLKGGGAQKQSALLAKSLSSQFSVCYIVFESDGMRESFRKYIENQPNIDVKYLTGGKLSIARSVYEIIKKEQPDIILSYLPFGNFLNGLCGRMLGTRHKIGGIRNAYTHDIKNIAQKYIHNFLLDASIANSDLGRTSHRDAGYTKKPIHHIPNCYILSQSETLRDEREQITLVTVGRFVEQKNYDLAINAFAKAKEKVAKAKGKDLRYKIVGYGELESAIRDHVSRLGLGDSVEIVLDPPNMDEHYKQSDIYLCTSRFEGLSNSIMEAMAFSLPVVATDVGGNSELVRPGINGMLTAQELDVICDSIVDLSLDLEKRKSFGKKSYNIINDEYSEAVFNQNYTTLINQLISR